MKEKIPLPELVYFDLPPLPQGSSRFSRDDGASSVFAQTFKAWGKQNKAFYYSYWIQPLSRLVIQPMDIETLDAHSLCNREIEGIGVVQWDFLSPPFFKQGESVLYIPSLIFSFHQEALDWKIPLLRAEEKVEAALSRFFKWAKVERKPWSSLFAIRQPSFSQSHPERVSLAVDQNVLFMKKMEGEFRGLLGVSRFLEKNIDWILAPKQDGSKNQLLSHSLATAMMHALCEHRDLISFSFTSPHHEASLKEEQICKMTGSGFSFEGMYSFAHPAFFLLILQAAFADSLQLIVDEFLNKREDPLSILRRKTEEAASRETLRPLPFCTGSMEALLEPKTMRCLAGIFNEREWLLVQRIQHEKYVSWMQKQMQGMKHLLPKISLLSEEDKKAMAMMEELERIQEDIWDFGIEAKAKALFELARPKMIWMQQHFKMEKYLPL